MANRINLLSVLVAAALVVGASGCAANSSVQSDSDLHGSGDKLLLSSSAAWQKKNLSVCWVNATPADAEAQEWTRDAITKTWQAVSQITFEGWGDCTPEGADIQINIADENPRSYIGTGSTWAIGQYGYSMVLDHTFAAWSPACQSQLEHCVRGIAVHEFGHALGFDHEQNRADRPAELTECAADGINVPGDKPLGVWDLYSVMNYCNPTWVNAGALSQGDIDGVQQVYGARE
jgi:Matrixin